MTWQAWPNNPKIIPEAIFQNFWFNGSHLENVVSFNFSGNFRRKYSYHSPQFLKVWNFWLNWIRPRANEVIIICWYNPRFSRVHVCIFDDWLFVCLFVCLVGCLFVGFAQHSTQQRLESLTIVNRNNEKASKERVSRGQLVHTYIISLFISCQKSARPNYIRILLKVNLEG